MVPTDRRVNGQKLKCEIPSEHKQNFLTMMVVKHRKCCPESLWSLLGDTKRLTKHRPGQPALVESSGAGVWTRLPAEIPSKLN